MSITLPNQMPGLDEAALQVDQDVDYPPYEQLIGRQCYGWAQWDHRVRGMTFRSTTSGATVQSEEWTKASTNAAGDLWDFQPLLRPHRPTNANRYELQVLCLATGGGALRWTVTELAAQGTPGSTQIHQNSFSVGGGAWVGDTLQVAPGGRPMRVEFDWQATGMEVFQLLVSEAPITASADLPQA